MSRDQWWSVSVTDIVTSAASRLELGARFCERYEIRRILGEGGMGVVYEAFDRVRATRVALKTMRHLDAATLYRFKNEFRALADVSHPNIASLHELSCDGDHTFFTMEYIEGVDFLAYVSQGSAVAATASTIGANVGHEQHASSGPILVAPPGAVACDVARLRAGLVQLVEGVAALHSCGKLHRDLKPSNVLVTREGRVVVLDFGLVFSLTPHALQTFEHNIVGTPAYMSPEQGASRELTESSDWYSVGVMLYQALAGRLPFDGAPLKILLDKQHVEPARPRDIAVGVPEDLDLLCMDLLQRDHAQRPTARALLQRLSGNPSVPRASALPSAATLPASDAVFVGRNRHLRELTESFAAARSGRGALAYVHGSSGVGKSLLVQRWLDGLSDRGEALVLSGRCYERESVPYKALDSIVDALSRHLRRLPPQDVDAVLPVEIRALTRLFPVLDRIAAVSAARRRAHEGLNPLELRRRAAAALRELLDRLSLRHPLVLWVDDVQWGDVDSAMLIHDLLRSPEPASFLLLLSYRTEDSASPLVAALREVRARDDRDAAVHEIEVDALDHAESRELALALLGAADPPTRALAEVIAGESRGNPLFVDELVRHVRTGEALERSDVSQTPVLRLDSVLHGRVSRLPDDARRLLEVIAVAGKPLSAPAAACAAELEGEREIAALAVLRAGRLVRSHRTQGHYEVETYHDRIRETVVARIDTASRAALHLGVARALLARGDSDPEALAVHFREGGDLPMAARLAAAAAVKAVEALAFDRAAGLWRSALELPGISAVASRDLQRKLAEALANAGRGADAAEAYLAAAEGASPRDGLELRRRAAEQLLTSGQFDAGCAAFRRVLSEEGVRIAWTPLGSVVFGLLRRVWLRIRGLGYRARTESEVDAALLRKMDVLWDVLRGLCLLDASLLFDLTVRLALLSLRAGEPKRIGRFLCVEAMSCAAAGDLARAQQLVDVAAPLTSRAGDPHTLGMSVMAQALVDFYANRWPTAVVRAEATTALFRESYTSVAWETAVIQQFGLIAMFRAGQLRNLRVASRALFDDAERRGDQFGMTSYGVGYPALLHLAADAPDEGRAAVGAIMKRWTREAFLYPHYHAFLFEALADLYVGDARAAWERVEQTWRALRGAYFLLFPEIAHEAFYLRGRAALARARELPAASSLRASLLRIARSDARRLGARRVPWPRANSALVSAGVESLSGNHDGARAHMEAAIRVCTDETSMPLFAAAARRQLGLLIRGDEGNAMVEAAEVAMRAEDVVRPARFAEMLVGSVSGTAV